MATKLQQLIETKFFSPEEIASRTREIYSVRHRLQIRSARTAGGCIALRG